MAFDFEHHKWTLIYMTSYTRTSPCNILVVANIRCIWHVRMINVKIAVVIKSVGTSLIHKSIFNLSIILSIYLIYSYLFH